jgi:hypothetical protein
MIIEQIGGYFLELDKRKWAQKIQKVLEIPKKSLIDNANHINNVCSSKIIDAKYFDKIKELIDKR